jgi:hypothetical protein
MYVTGTGGEVREINIKTRQTRSISGGQTGYYRAYYLSNGDYLLTKGPTRESAKLYLLDKGLSKPAVDLGIIVREGAAVSRKQLKIAYTTDMSSIYTAEIRYTNGVPALWNEVEVVSNGNSVEPQNFRPPAENELIYSCYGCGANEVYGVNLTTLSQVNYSNAPSTKEEPEGILPNGQYTLMESDKHYLCGDQCIDVYRLKLDGLGTNFTRLTFFFDETNSNGDHYKASNPSVRDDGMCFCFQEAVAGAAAGVGQGIYLYDMAAAGISDPPIATDIRMLRARPDNDVRAQTVGIFDLRGRMLASQNLDGAAAVSVPRSGVYIASVAGLNGNPERRFAVYISGQPWRW